MIPGIPTCNKTVAHPEGFLVNHASTADHHQARWQRKHLGRITSPDTINSRSTLTSQDACRDTWPNSDRYNFLRGWAHGHTVVNLQ